MSSSVIPFGRWAGIVVVGAHVLLAIYGIVVIPHFLRRLQREQVPT
jgi:hypothetical protein